MKRSPHAKMLVPVVLALSVTLICRIAAQPGKSNNLVQARMVHFVKEWNVGTIWLRCMTGVDLEFCEA